MTLRRNMHRLLWVLLLGCVNGDGADQWQPLLERNPFVAYQPPVPPPPEPPPPYEFRGRSVENGVEYFSLYNLETRKAFWAGAAGGEGLRIQSYDPVRGLVLADIAGRTIHLTLKEARPIGGRDVQPRQGTVLVVAPAGAPNAAESPQLLEQVAEQIRARRALRSQATGTKI